MEMVVAKILCLFGMFGLMLAAILIPVRMMQSDLDKAVRYRRAVAFSNSFGGGVFLATCFNALLPAVRDKVSVTRAVPLFALNRLHGMDSTSCQKYYRDILVHPCPCECIAAHSRA